MKRMFVFVLVLLLVFIMTACGFPSNQIPKRALCDTCKSFVVGNWYYINEAGAVVTVEYCEDGTIIQASGNGWWTCNCTGNQHSITTGESNACYGDSYYDPEDIGHLNALVKNDGYTFVELTEDNWRDYFSENFDEVFDIRSELILCEETNAWGESSVSHIGIHKYALLKDQSRYGPLTTLTLEYDFAYSIESADVDTEQLKLLQTEIAELEQMQTATRTTTSNENGEVLLSLGWDENEPISDRIYAHLEVPGEKIHRMKGVLVIKNNS